MSLAFAQVEPGFSCGNFRKCPLRRVFMAQVRARGEGRFPIWKPSQSSDKRLLSQSARKTLRETAPPLCSSAERDFQFASQSARLWLARNLRFAQEPLDVSSFARFCGASALTRQRGFSGLQAAAKHRLKSLFSTSREKHFQTQHKAYQPRLPLCSNPKRDFRGK